MDGAREHIDDDAVAQLNSHSDLFWPLYLAWLLPLTDRREEVMSWGSPSHWTIL